MTAGSTPSGPTPGHPEQRRLLDFAALAGRLRVAGGVLAVLALVGVIVEGLRTGLTFGAMLKWSGILVAAFLAVAALLVAYHAYRGAGAAQRRGERLSGPDVGLTPPRRPPE